MVHVICFSTTDFLFYLNLAMTVTKRQWLLEESIGTMEIEDEAFKTVWITFSIGLVSFVFVPIISLSIFKRINTTLHPGFDIIKEEMKREKDAKNKEKCCGIFSIWSKFNNTLVFNEHL